MVVSRFVQFGKDVPPKRSLKTLAMSNYMKASVVPFPAVHAWERSIPYGMLANDKLGCCVIAGCAHLEMNWRAIAAQPYPFFATDDQIIADYSAVTGYIVGDSSTDNGTNMLDAMHYGLRKGF